MQGLCRTYEFEDEFEGTEVMFDRAFAAGMRFIMGRRKRTREVVEGILGLGKV